MIRGTGSSRARMGVRIDSVDRPVRRASFEAESDMPADYTCATARVVLCLDHEAPYRRGRADGTRG